MSDPRTPRRAAAPQDEPDGIHSPTKARTTTWEAGVNKENDRLKGAISKRVQMLESTTEVMQEIQGPAAEQGFVRVMFELFKQFTQDRNIDLDIFLDEDVRGRARSLLKADLREERVTTGEGDSDSDSDTDAAKDNDTTDDDNDSDTVIPVDSPTGRRRHRKSDDNADGQALVKVDAWVREYTKLGWVDGDGSTKDSAIIVGKVPAPAKVVSVKIPQGPTADTHDTKKAYKQFSRWMMEEHRIYGRRSGSNAWMRLHPRAVTTILNLFFGSLIGIPALTQLNSIIKAYAKQSDAGVNRVHAARAEHIAKTHRDRLPPLAVAVFELLAVGIRDEHKDDAYTRFLARVHSAQLLRKYQDFTDACSEHPEGREARLVSKGLGRRATRGVTWRSLSKRYFAQEVDMKEAALEKILNKSRAMVPFINTFGEPILLIMPHTANARLLKCALQDLDAVCKKFNELVPELKVGVAALKARVIDRFETFRSSDITFLSDNKFSTSGKTDWLSRVTGVMVPRDVSEVMDDDEDEEDNDSDNDDGADGMEGVER